MADVEGSKEVPYDSAPNPGWVEQVNSWEWVERDKDERSKSGPCPRCGHQIGFTEESWTGMELMASAQSAPTRFAACNCSVEHPGAPKGELGCGAHGLVDRPAPEVAFEEEQG